MNNGIIITARHNRMFLNTIKLVLRHCAHGSPFCIFIHAQYQLHFAFIEPSEPSELLVNMRHIDTYYDCCRVLGKRWEHFRWVEQSMINNHITV
jgi:hypothetical protein